MMQADREHNFNWPVNCPAVTTHEKGPIEFGVIIIIINIFHCMPKKPHKESSLPTFLVKIHPLQMFQ